MYSDNLSRITKVLKSESLQIGRVNDVDVSKGNDGEYVMKLKYTDTPKNAEESKFTLTGEQIQLMIYGTFNILKFDSKMTCK